jgi:uncharacterized membrane protein
MMAGFFFAFSNSVMGAVARLPSAQGIAAMQAINVVMLNRLFLSLFLGTAAACILLAGSSLFAWHQADAPYRLIASSLYLVGSIVVTIVFNVPRNEGLAVVAAASPEGATRWLEFVPVWTAWNHVRTITSLLAMVFFTLALLHR